jgi:hypothetical protein
MGMRNPLVQVILAASMLIAPCPGVMAQTDPAAPNSRATYLVNGILARVDAIFSGRMSYNHVIFDHTEELDLSFSGNDWIMRWKEGGMIRSRGGASVDYFFATQPDETVYRAATLARPRTIAKEKLSTPIRAGTLRLECTRDFIAKNRDRARLGEKSSIDGMKADVLEWDVAASEVYQAFEAVDGIARRGGVLRLHTVEDRGFILPLIEHIGEKGKPQDKYMSRKFREVAPGVFFPMEYEHQGYLVSGLGMREEFHIHKVELVNQEIPAKDFLCRLPIGTVVTDIRSDQMTVFGLVPDAPQLKELTGIIECEVPPAPWSIWQWHYAVALVLGLALIAPVFLTFRKWVSRGKASA